MTTQNTIIMELKQLNIIYKHLTKHKTLTNRLILQCLGLKKINNVNCLVLTDSYMLVYFKTSLDDSYLEKVITPESMHEKINAYNKKTFPYIDEEWLKANLISTEDKRELKGMKYPDIERLIPSELESLDCISLDSNLLALTQSIMNLENVTLTFTGKQKPILLKANNKNDLVNALILPVRTYE